jgi:hypothetical protein
MGSSRYSGKKATGDLRDSIFSASFASGNKVRAL